MATVKLRGDEQHGDLLSVIAMASTTDALVTALRIPAEPQFQVG